jgi:hypothetical protein
MAQPTARPGIHPTVWYLLYLNYEHLKSTVGVEAAKQVMADVLGAFARKSRGRSLKIPLPMLIRAKALHDEGKSYSQIAIKLGLRRQQVRSALEHHYGEKKSR